MWCSYYQAAVWLRYGECLNALGEVVHAAEAYQKVVELAPSHTGICTSSSCVCAPLFAWFCGLTAKRIIQL